MSQNIVDARLIGIVGKPHGIKGEVNVMLLTDYPDSILKGSVLSLDEDCKEDMIIENIYLRRSKGRVSAVIMFQGIEGRDGAEALRGKELFRKTDDIPLLDEDEFWIDDLEGCQACLRDNNTEIGIVEKVEVLPSNDNLVIKPDGGGKHIYIPLIDEYVDCVDIGQKK